MKQLKVIIILTVFFVTLSATNVWGQGKQARTRGAQAAYGYPTGEYKAKKKKKKKKQKKTKARKKKGKEPLYRKKNPWVN